MVTARDIMTIDPGCVNEHQTLAEAAEILARLEVGSLPICGEDQSLKGILTDRDIVVRCLAKGGDPALTRAGDLAEGTLATIDADDTLEQAMATMQAHQVRRLPVVEGRNLVGMISQADIARAVSTSDSGETVGAISQ